MRFLEIKTHKNMRLYGERELLIDGWCAGASGNENKAAAPTGAPVLFSGVGFRTAGG